MDKTETNAAYLWDWCFMYESVHISLSYDGNKTRASVSSWISPPDVPLHSIQAESCHLQECHVVAIHYFPLALLHVAMTHKARAGCLKMTQLMTGCIFALVSDVVSPDTVLQTVQMYEIHILYWQGLTHRTAIRNVWVALPNKMWMHSQ